MFVQCLQLVRQLFKLKLLPWEIGHWLFLSIFCCTDFIVWSWFNFHQAINLVLIVHFKYRIVLIPKSLYKEVSMNYEASGLLKEQYFRFSFICLSSWDQYFLYYTCFWLFVPYNISLWIFEYFYDSVYFKFSTLQV